MNQNEEIFKKLTESNHTHLLNYWTELNKVQKSILSDEIQSMDFASFNLITNSKTANTHQREINFTKDRVSEMQIDHYFKLTQSDLNQYELAGLEAIAKDQVAMICLAGGMSTRLSIDYPKGMYSIDSLSSKTLFQLQAEKILSIKNLAYLKYSNRDIKIPWYIMTSPHTHDMTLQFFQENNFFGLNLDDVIIFKQEMQPCLSPEKYKLKLRSKNSINQAPEGNGGLYSALIKNKILKDMSVRGIEYIHIYGVENVLVKMADPVLTGYCVVKKLKCTAKVVNKVIWNEPINRLCFKGNKLCLIDFSLVAKQSIQAKLDSNERNSIFNLGDMCYYFISSGLLKNLCKKNEQLSMFRFNRLLNFIDEKDGKNKKQNCVVFEKFLTDLFPSEINLFEVDRTIEYSPLVYMNTGEPFNKHACKKNMMHLHFSWLIDAGSRFHYTNHIEHEIKCLNHRHDESRAEDLPDICEISPLVSYSGENLEKYVKGKSFEPPLVLDLDQKTNQITYNGLEYFEYEKIGEINSINENMNE